MDFEFLALPGKGQVHLHVEVAYWVAGSLVGGQLVKMLMLCMF